MLGHAGCGQEENTRDKTLESFYRVILLRESFDTKYVLGWLDCTCDWTTVRANMVQMRMARIKRRFPQWKTGVDLHGERLRQRRHKLQLFQTIN